MSLGESGTDSVLTAAVENAINAGIVVVAAAGNEPPGRSTTLRSTRA